MPGAEVAAAAGLIRGPMDDAFSIDRLSVGAAAKRARPTPKRLTPSAAPVVALNINMPGMMPPHAPSLLDAGMRSPSPGPSFLAAPTGLAGDAPPVLAYTNYGWTPPAWLPHPVFAAPMPMPMSMPTASELTYAAFPVLLPPAPATAFTAAGPSSASAARISAMPVTMPVDGQPRRKRRRAHSESEVGGANVAPPPARPSSSSTRPSSSSTRPSSSSTRPSSSGASMSPAPGSSGSPPPTGPSSGAAAAPTAKSGQLCVTCSLRPIYCKGYCRSCYEKLPETKAKTRERHQRYNRSAQGRSRVRRFRARKAAAEALVLAQERVADP